jgi:hypothetical protein
VEERYKTGLYIYIYILSTNGWLNYILFMWLLLALRLVSGGLRTRG